MPEIFDKSEAEKNSEKAKRKRDRELSDLREVVKTPAGRRFYWRILEDGGVFLDPFCGDRTNETHVRIGMQRLSRKYLNELLLADREAFNLMQREQGNLDKHEEIEHEKKLEEFNILNSSV